MLIASLLVLLLVQSASPLHFHSFQKGFRLLPMLATPPRPSNNSKSTASPTDVAKHPDNSQENMMTSKAHPRTCILKVGSRAGQLCELAITHLPFEVKDEPEKDISKDDELAACMSQLLQALFFAPT